MKKLIVLSAIAVLSSGSALATSHDFSPSGEVAVVCEASGISGDFEFTEAAIKNPTSSTPIALDFTVECNSANDAEIKLKSSNGWLENQANAAYGVKYTAKLEIADASSGWELVMNANNTAKPTINTQALTSSAEIADGSAATLTVSLTGGSGNTMAGNYEDNLLLTITAM